jgi:hypothetical protein
VRTFVRRGADRRARHAVSLLFVALLAVPTQAWGEIVVLKAGGERIPCRVLHQDKEKVIVRVSTGTERTIEMSEVAEILPDTSNVETYEAVGETMPPDHGIVAYHLGVWCLENDMESNGRRLLEFAAGNPRWAGRANIELARSARSAEQRFSSLLNAVVADPTLEEAVDALAGGERKPVEIPQETLRTLVRAVDSARMRDPKSAHAKLLTIRENSSPRILGALSTRMTMGMGLGFDEFVERCAEGLSGTDVGSSGTQGSATTDCQNCRGHGYVTCEVCQNKGYIACKTCNGKGTTSATKRRSDRKGSTTTVVRKCQSCGGNGYRECRACVRRPKGGGYDEQSMQVEQPCPDCRGQGKEEKRRTVSTGRKTKLGRGDTYTRTTYVDCARCSGRGSLFRSVSLKDTGSGWRRCPLCNKDGKIALGDYGDQSSAERKAERAKKRREMSSRTRTRSRGEVNFTPEEAERLKRFATLLSNVSAGRAGYLWRAGGKVPLQLSMPDPGAGREEAANEFTFVGGSWVTPSTAKLKQQHARMLGYKPRRVSLSPFVEWLQAKELAFLRKHSLDIGAGAEPGASIAGITSYFERAQVIGSRDAFDRVRVFRTTFLPDSGARGKDRAACRWKVRRATGEEIVSLVLLRDPDRWPRLEMVATALTENGLDMNRLGSELVAHSGSPLTVYYRVVSCRKTERGSGDDAVSHLTLDIDVAAAVIGPERRPKKIWIQGTECLLDPKRRASGAGTGTGGATEEKRSFGRFQ